MIIFVAFLVILIGLVEGIPLFKKKMYKELLAAAILLLIAILLEALNYFGIMNPRTLVQKYVEPIGKIVFKDYKFH